MESQCNACSKIFEKTDDCPYHQFVMTTHDKGRLGNKMSEYATLLAVSALTGFTPVLSKFEFFIRAMIKLKETLSDSNPNFDPSNLVYLVSSDDVDWIKDNFQTLAHAETIIYAANAFESKFEFPPNHLDMCIMSKCNHSIVDYGTFGFWGAYLAGGHTIQAENIGTGFSIQVESIKQAKLSKWQFIEAHSRQTP
eukprot:TCALIF_09571-PA protein Name:"Similar to Fut1 Galactoside 2-alpha-L-fucosyltransferase 1 (Rattus norvegicus)" AED:0.17 eAED:0.17 QI:91/0.66/0.75/1/0.33/0.25/4/58/194